MAPHHAISQTFLRTLWLFQAIAASPIFIFLGLNAFGQFRGSFRSFYDYITALSTTVVDGGIIFIVLVQRKIPEDWTTVRLTLRFEIVKAVLATFLWVWLMLDTAFNPTNNYLYYDRTLRMQAVGFTSTLLL